MAFINSTFFYLTSILFFFGPSLRLNILSLSIPIFDISLSLYIVSQLLIQKKPLNKYLLIFISWCLTSFLINLLSYHLSLLSIFYFIRLINICLLLSIRPVLKPNQSNFFQLIIFSNIIFGFIQYIFFKDMYDLKYLGWDPHQNRLVSTYLDPTYTALIYLFFLVFAYCKKYPKIILLVTYTALALTYSRSTLLALAISSLFYSLKKYHNFKMFLKTFILIFFTLLVLPTQAGESTNLKRTSTIKAKIENYYQSIKTISQKPAIGHGHNNLPLIKKTYHQFPSHTIAGFDSSLLTIASTTGIIGLILFLVFLKNIFMSSTIEVKTVLIAMFVHSLFANSLLYPWSIFCLYNLFLIPLKSHR